MKVQIYVVLFALSMLSVGAIGQCARPEMNPVWDTDKQQFRCVATAGSEVPSHGETVSPTGRTAFRNHPPENPLKASPPSTQRHTCNPKPTPLFNPLSTHSNS